MNNEITEPITVTEPSLVAFPFSTLYVPVYSLDGGVTWSFLEPCTNLGLAKTRLKSKLPDGYHLASDDRFKSVRCGLLMAKTQSLAFSEFFAEFCPSDFVGDALGSEV
jgi:hypothetical protein